MSGGPNYVTWHCESKCKTQRPWFPGTKRIEEVACLVSDFAGKLNVPGVMRSNSRLRESAGRSSLETKLNLSLKGTHMIVLNSPPPSLFESRSESGQPS